MELNRRNTLIGLGSAAAAGGAVAGTGAFTSIEADRQVTVTVEGDGDAYLALLPYDGPNGSKYATTNGAGALSITLDKVNPNAVTTIDNVFQVLNQGSQPISFYIEDRSDAVSFRSEGASVEGESAAVRLAVGETVSVGMEVDTTDGQAEGDTLLESVTIHAEADQAPGATGSNVLYVDDDFSNTDQNKFTTISGAISAASSGDTIQVAGGDYSGFSIDETSDLTITGAGGTSSTTGVTGGVTVKQSGTTLSGLRIAPEGGSQASGAAVFVGTPGSDVSGVSLLNNVIDSTNQGTEDPGGNPEKKHGIKVQTNGPAMSGIEVLGNTVQNVVTSGAVTANGVYFESEGGGSYSNVRVANNVVETVESGDLWAYGIRSNTSISGFEVVGNEVTTIVGNANGGGGADPFYYTEGIGIENGSNTTGTVSRNDVTGVETRNPDDESKGSPGVGVVVGSLTDASQVTVNYNDLAGNQRSIESKVTSGTLDATNNWFGSTSGPSVLNPDPTEPNRFNPGTQNGVVEADGGGEDIQYTPWLDDSPGDGGESFAPVEVNNSSSETVSVPSFRAGVDALESDGTMRVNGGSGDEFDEGDDVLAVGVANATIRATGSGRPTLLNTDTGGSQDYAIRLQADGLRLEGIRVFTDDSADTPKEIRIEANNVTVTDCEVDRGHTAGTQATRQSGIQVSPNDFSGVGIMGNRVNKAAIGMGAADATVKANLVTNPAKEGIFSAFIDGSEGFIIEQNDVDDYDQADEGAAALKLTDVPGSVNGVSASTAEPYTDEILSANPEVPEVLVKDSDGTDSRKTQ